MSGAIKQQASVKFDIPVKAGDVAAFLATVPADALVTVATFEGGTQRDPYQTAYAFVARWEAR